MKQKNLYVLDETDSKIVHLFTELGMPRNLAKTLMFVSQVEECCSADVEHGTDLRQPEVCLAVNEFVRRGWIKKREVKKKGKGRPQHIYRFTSSLRDIVTSFEKEKMLEIGTLEKNLSEIRTIIRSR